MVIPFEIPIGWERIKGIDYGYASESACVWGGAVDPTDGTLIIYRELYQKNLTGVDLAQVITNMEVYDPYSVQGVLIPQLGQELVLRGQPWGKLPTTCRS